MKIRKMGIVIVVLISLSLISCNRGDTRAKDSEVIIETEPNITEDVEELDDTNKVKEEKIEDSMETSESKAYELYLKDMQKEYPDSVSRAVQNYVVNANATMSKGEIPSNRNMMYVIEDEFTYDSDLAFQWEYTALQYRGCQIIPVGTNYVYAFDLEEYLLDYCINDDFDEETETFSGIVYFQYRIAEDSNSDNIIVKAENVTACLEFKVKYCEEKGHYRLIELEYLSSRNECDKYADCTSVGHDWDSKHKCDAICIKCGAVKGKCTPGEEATCTNGQYCAVCNKLLLEHLGHDFSKATCDSPATCKRCGYVENDELGHEWEFTEGDGSCICKICRKHYCQLYSYFHEFVDGYCKWCRVKE